MLKIVICDDEDIYIEQIKMFISDLSTKIPDFTVNDCSSGEALFQELQDDAIYDIALLDIHMNRMSGIDVADKLRKHFQNDKTILIYISAHDNRAKEVFQFKTHRFLSKPIERDLFEEALLSAVQLWQEQQSLYFSFKDTKLGHVKMPLKDILYMESSRSHCVNVITADCRYTIYDAKLSELHEKFSSSGFILIHHSTLVNFDHIKLIRYEEVTMSDEKILSISGPKRKPIREHFHEIRKKQEKNLWP